MQISPVGTTWQEGGAQVRTQVPLRLCWAKRHIGSIPPGVPLAITRTNGPWTHTSGDSYIYQLSPVLATSIVSILLDTRSTRSGIQILPLNIYCCCTPMTRLRCALLNSFRLLFSLSRLPPALALNPIQPYYPHMSNIFIIRSFKPFCFVPRS